jgi:hypothetical protein
MPGNVDQGMEAVVATADGYEWSSVGRNGVRSAMEGITADDSRLVA